MSFHEGNGGDGGPDRSGRRPGRWSYEPYRRRAIDEIRRAGRTTAGWVAVAARWVDVALQRLDRAVREAREAALRRSGLDPGRLTVPRVVSRAPDWFQRGVEAVGGWFGSLGRWFYRAFPFLPRDREWRKAASGLALLLVVVTLANLTAPPEAKPLPGAWNPVFIGYFENGWGGIYGDSYPEFQRHAEYIDILMPFWYSIHPDGSIEDRGARREVINFAHASGIPVVPLVNNAKIGTSAGFLVDPAARQEAAAELKALVSEMGYDGVHIDFELLPPYWREELTSFIAEIRAALGPDKHLSAAVFPQVDVPYEVSGVHDYAALSGFCDFVVLMGYDRHYAGGPPGPISPDDWIERNIYHALYELGVPADKFVLAVGGYGYDWSAGGGVATSIPSRFIADLAYRRGATLEWDSASRNPYFVYYEGRVRHEVWYQDERVMSQRIALARKYGLRGLALWRVGYETPETWSVIDTELGTRSRRSR